MNADLENFYLTKEEPNQSCLLALRDIILNTSNEITETIKYGMPCFCHEKKPICYLWTDKKTNEPYILLVAGKQIEHPKLEQGNRSRMKIMRITPKLDLPVEDIIEVINQSIAAIGY